MTPAVAAANGQQTSAREPGTSKPPKTGTLTLAQKLKLKVKAARKYRGAVRFFQTRRALALTAGKRAPGLARRRFATTSG